jgi:hypothetical protein
MKENVNPRMELCHLTLLTITDYFYHKGVRVMVFNVTFNNVSVISRQSVLLLEETGVPEKTTNLQLEVKSSVEIVHPSHILEND